MKSFIYPILICSIVFNACINTYGQCINKMTGNFSGEIIAIDTADSSILCIYSTHTSFSDIDCSNHTFQYFSGKGCVWEEGNGLYSNDYDTIYYTCATWDGDGYVCCPVSYTLIRYGPNPTGTVQITNPANLNVYPNPFHNSTTLALLTYQKYFLEIDDISGRKLKWIEFTGNQYELFAEGLCKGLYFLRIFDGNNTTIGITKIVVE